MEIITLIILVLLYIFKAILGIKVVNKGPRGGRYYVNKNGNKTYLK